MARWVGLVGDENGVGEEVTETEVFGRGLEWGGGREGWESWMGWWRKGDGVGDVGNERKWGGLIGNDNGNGEWRWRRGLEGTELSWLWRDCDCGEQ